MFRAVAAEGISERARERRSMGFAVGLLTIVSVAAVVAAILIAIHDARGVAAPVPPGSS